MLRKCFVPSETLLLLNEYKGQQEDNSLLFPHKDNVMRNSLHKLFKRIGANVSSHDFRHSKLTDLGKHLSPQDVRDYAGHSSISITDVYLHSKQEDVLKRVAGLYGKLRQQNHQILPKKRSLKEGSKQIKDPHEIHTYVAQSVARSSK